MSARLASPVPYAPQRPRVPLFSILVLVSILTACGGDDRIEKSVGEHHISFLAPSDWEFYDQGRELRFERRFEERSAALLIKDLGLRLPPEDGGATLAEWLDYDLKRLDTTTQRGVAARDSFVQQGHTFYVMDTWDRLTHEHRRRHVIVPNQGRHLAVYVELGDWQDTQRGFESLLKSLQFLEVESGTGAESRERDE